MAGEHAYLLSYNTISLCLWSYLTCRTLATLASPNTRPGLHDLYPDFLFPWLVVAQSLAALEVLHAASGLVRASPWTTAIQVGGKNLVVWTVMVQFPDIVNGLDGRVGFVGCLVAWGLSEMVRYGFFVVLLARGEAPAWLKWLRYSAFIILYPPGFLSEAWLVYLSLVRATNVGAVYRGYLFVGLLSYIPAGYILYTYMLSQRRRALKPPSRK